MSPLCELGLNQFLGIDSRPHNSSVKAHFEEHELCVLCTYTVGAVVGRDKPAKQVKAKCHEDFTLDSLAENDSMPQESLKQ